MFDVDVQTYGLDERGERVLDCPYVSSEGWNPARRSDPPRVPPHRWEGAMGVCGLWGALSDR